MKLEEHPGQLTRAAVELAKQWRTDKFLRKLDVSWHALRSAISADPSGTCAWYLWSVVCAWFRHAWPCVNAVDHQKRSWLGSVQAVMIVADGKQSLQITGNGDVLEPHDGVIGEHSSHVVPCCPKLKLLHLLDVSGRKCRTAVTSVDRRRRGGIDWT